MWRNCLGKVETHALLQFARSYARDSKRCVKTLVCIAQTRWNVTSILEVSLVLFWLKESDNEVSIMLFQCFFLFFSWPFACYGHFNFLVRMQRKIESKTKSVIVQIGLPHDKFILVAVQVVVQLGNTKRMDLSRNRTNTAEWLACIHDSLLKWVVSASLYQLK